jgi:HAT1-interacting factor 1
LLLILSQLAELKAPPVDVKDALYGSANGGNAAAGILGTALGESPADAAARVEEAKKNATDLTGLVRHKKKPIDSSAATGFTPEQSSSTNGTNGKRKAEDEGHSEAKKAKVEEAAE